MEKMNIAIVGFGLMGGSLGKAIKENTVHRVFAIDRDEAVLKEAIKQHAADETGGTELLQNADLVILALSPEGCIGYLKQNAAKIKNGAAVSDICGVKRAVVPMCEEICRENGLRFIGGHPMAGKERSGFENSDAELFFGASYILTPTENTATETTAMMMELAVSIGCRTATVTTPENHDRMIAFTSQLPHVLAGSYVKSPEAPEHKGYSAGSFRDVSRVATVDETLWSQLFLDNGDFLSAEIGMLIENLSEYKRAIDGGDKTALENAIRRGREIKTALNG